MVSLLPWTSAPPPRGIVCPSDRGKTLDAGQLEEAMVGKTIIVMCCTFQLREEESAASQVVDQLLRLQGSCILGAADAGVGIGVLG